MAAFYCAVCRQTSFSGKGHIFGKTHQSRLRVVLLKFVEKVKEARRTIKKPQVEKFDCTSHSCTFWCYCCGIEVERGVSDGKVTVMHAGLLEHMATPEHRKNAHKFWFANKADPKLRDRVIVTSEEIERFKAEVAKALDSYVEKEDEVIKQHADIIRAQEKHRQEILQSLTEPKAELELPNGFHSHNTPVEQAASSDFRPLGSNEQAGPSWVDPMVDGQWAGPGQGLTFIGYQDSSSGGNVHTGGVPPWLQDDPLEGSSGAVATAQAIGPSLQEFLKQKEQEKLRKLPPNRVGANFDHSSQTDADWLPSFGRVWNSGRRWQSRHQFREEERQKKKGRKRESAADGSKKLKASE